MGKSLMMIRDRRLYLYTHDSFEKYLQERFGFSRDYAKKQIRAYKVFENIKNRDNCIPSNEAILPTSEGQIRCLGGQPKDIQIEVWREAVALAKGRPTAKVINQVLKQTLYLRERTKPMDSDKLLGLRNDDNPIMPGVKIRKGSNGENIYFLTVDRELHDWVSGYCQKKKIISFNAALRDMLRRLGELED